ncbi:hypothetical protein AB0L74_02150 [Streptomyces sp. NPDC052020]|uniref:hypothetical protein n=1 Tax=Streptomyces sp. NPDC052020 TaxID=3155677 RepID=UPI003419F665
MPPRRHRRAARRTVLAALVLTAAAGCGDAGGLQGAGATPTAVSPARLWPDLPPASTPAWDFDEADTETVKGVTVPGGGIRTVDPAAVVRAEIAAHPDDYAGSRAPYRETARRMDGCRPGGDRDRCPLLEPYYRDLTGDGREDMTLGFRLPPTNQTAVRVYTVAGHRLVQVMSNNDAVSAVELAGRSVIIRSPSDLAGYEYRVQWTWDPDQRAMLLTHDEMLRTGERTPASRPSVSSPASAARSPSPSSPSSSLPSSASGR